MSLSDLGDYRAALSSAGAAYLLAATEAVLALMRGEQPTAAQTAEWDNEVLLEQMRRSMLS